MSTGAGVGGGERDANVPAEGEGIVVMEFFAGIGGMRAALDRAGELEWARNSAPRHSTHALY